MKIFGFLNIKIVSVVIGIFIIVKIVKVRYVYHLENAIAKWKMILMNKKEYIVNNK